MGGGGNSPVSLSLVSEENITIKINIQGKMQHTQHCQQIEEEESANKKYE
jgi:hypothetical protein